MCVCACACACVFVHICIFLCTYAATGAHCICESLCLIESLCQRATRFDILCFPLLVKFWASFVTLSIY